MGKAKFTYTKNESEMSDKETIRIQDIQYRRKFVVAIGVLYFCQTEHGFISAISYPYSPPVQ